MLHHTNRATRPNRTHPDTLHKQLQSSRHIWPAGGAGQLLTNTNQAGDDTPANSRIYRLRLSLIIAQIIANSAQSAHYEGNAPEPNNLNLN